MPDAPGRTVIISADSGQSAYELAVKHGFVGTEQEYLDSLKGETGPAKGFTNRGDWLTGTTYNPNDYVFNSGSMWLVKGTVAFLSTVAPPSDPTNWEEFVIGGAPFVPTSRSILTQHSLQGGGNLTADRTLSLVGDTASPGANKVYSTDGAGVRGWYSAGAGSGDVVGPASAVDSEVALFSGTTGKIIKRATGSGRPLLTSGVLSLSAIDLSGADATGILAAARFPALTGDVTTSAGSLATTITADSVTFAKMQNIATDSLIGRDTAGTGDPEVIGLGTDFVMISGTLAVAIDSITLNKMADIATDSILGRATAGTGDPEVLTALPFAYTGDVTRAADSNATTVTAIQNKSISLATGFLKYNGSAFVFDNTAFLASVPSSKVVYVDTGGNDGTGARGDESKPFLTIGGALGAAGLASGDVIYLRPGTFAAAASTQVVLPAGVHLIGSGMNVSILTGTVGTASALVVPGTGSVIGDLTIDNSSSPTSSGGFIGCVGANTAFTSALVYNVRGKGGIDGFYFDKSGVTGLVAMNCIVETSYDAYAHGPTAPGTMEFYNCTTVCDAQSVNPAARPFSINGGTWRYFGGTLKALGSAAVNALAVVSGGSLELHNVRLDMTPSGTVNWDLQQTGGVLAIHDCVRAGGGPLQTSGTIFDLSPITPVTVNDYSGSFGVPTTGSLLQPTRLTEVTTARATIQGTGRVTTFDPANDFFSKSVASPASVLIRSGESLRQYQELALSGNSRVTMVGSGRVNAFADPLVFQASGSSHTAGLVPDPGATLGATRFLCENASWQVPGGGGNVSTTGTPASGNLTQFSGATTITNGDLSGDVTTSGTLAATIPNNTVTYAKMQDVSAASKLLGRGDSGAGDPQEITLGSGLAMTGTTLSVSAGGGNVSNTGTPVDNQLAIWTSANVIEGQAGINTDGANKIILGVSGVSVGGVDFKNATSGTVTIQPTTGALGTVTMTLPAANSNPVQPDAGAANNFLTAISSSGVISKAQPSFSNISGSVDLGGAQASGTLAAGRFPALTGDVTTSAGSLSTTITNDTVTFAKFQNISTNVILGRATASSGDMEELTALPFALTGDVTTVADANATTIANDAVTTAKILDANVTYAKIQDVSAASKLLGRGDSGSGDVQELTLGTNLSMSGTTLNAAGGGGSQTPWTQNVDADGFNLLVDDATGIKSSEAGNPELLLFTSVASAVNELTLTNAATGGQPILSATGDDTNIGIKLQPKGTGETLFVGDSGSSIGFNVTSSSAGTLNITASFGGNRATWNNTGLSLNESGASFSLQNAGMFKWGDIGLARNAAGIVEVNSGTGRSYAELRANYVVTFGVSSGGFGINFNRITMESTDRGSILGTGRIHVTDVENRNEYLPGKAVSNPPQFSLRSMEFLLQYARLAMSGNERGSLSQNARLVMQSPDGPRSRLVLAGRGGVGA